MKRHGDGDDSDGRTKQCRLHGQRYCLEELARRYCDMLACQHPILCLRSGVMLKASSQQGLTEFLVLLRTEMKNRGWLTVYVDLANEGRGPGKSAEEQMLDAIDNTRRHQVGRWRTLFQGIVSAVSKGQEVVHGVASLAERLQALESLSGKPVALLINRAEYLMQTRSGRRAAFQIKSARDALCNLDGSPRLPLVLAGSCREQLADLEAHRHSPFFCIYVDELAV